MPALPTLDSPTPPRPEPDNLDEVIAQSCVLLTALCTAMSNPLDGPAEQQRQANLATVGPVCRILCAIPFPPASARLLQESLEAIRLMGKIPANVPGNPAWFAPFQQLRHHLDGCFQVDTPSALTTGYIEAASAIAETLVIPCHILRHNPDSDDAPAARAVIAAVCRLTNAIPFAPLAAELILSTLQETTLHARSALIPEPWHITIDDTVHGLEPVATRAS